MEIEDHQSLAFREFGKIARFRRDVVITEKIDGTNAQILIRKLSELWGGDGERDLLLEFAAEDMGRPIFVPDPDNNDKFVVLAGSRKRWLGPGDQDNFAFWHWVNQNAADLVHLGVGRHFGEWWGSGIQRTYGLTNGDKRFSLFNVHRWGEPETRPVCCGVVPVLYTGPIGVYLDDPVRLALDDLRVNGSKAAPGFMKPEGIVVYHTAANQLFKVTLEKDEVPKSLAEKAAA